MLYHTTALIRLRQIMKKGLSPSELTLAEQVYRTEEAIAEGEITEICSVEVQHMLDEALSRPEAVYFWTDFDQAYKAMAGMKDLGLEFVVLEVNPGQIPCECTIGDTHITDVLYDMYYQGYTGMRTVSFEEEEEWIKSWEETVESYNPMTEYPYFYEVYCPCDISPKAIRAVYTQDRKKMVVQRWLTERKITEW